MNAAPSTSRRPLLEVAAVLTRWLSGALFVYMGLINLLDTFQSRNPFGFLELLRQYDLVVSPLLLNWIAAALAALEALYGVLLLTGIAVEAASALARWLLGAVFIYMGLNKALHPVDFLKLVHQYELVQTPLLLNSIAAALPWFEFFCGALLLTGVAVRGSALMLVVMLVPFTLVVLRRALAIHAASAIPFCAIKFDCGCGTGEVYICSKLVENSLMIFLSGWLLGGRGRRLAARYSLW